MVRYVTTPKKPYFLWVCFNFPSPSKKKEVPFLFPSHQDSQLLCTHGIKKKFDHQMGIMEFDSHILYDFPIRTSPDFLWVCFNFPSNPKKKFHSPSLLSRVLSYYVSTPKNLGSSDGYKGIWLNYSLFQLKISFRPVINRFPMRIKIDFFQRLVIFG